LTNALEQGDPSRDFVDVGPVGSPARIDALRRHIDDALAKGARLLCGGRAAGAKGHFFQPTILADCEPSMTVVRDEVYGPVVALMRTQGDEQAVARANDSVESAVAYVFTKSRARAHWLALRLRATSVVVNDVRPNYSACGGPFGGIDPEGFGSGRGLEGLREFCRRKYMSYDRIAPPARDPLWFPYTAKNFQWLERGTQLLFGGGSLAQRIGRIL
jgi:succinate-semialdehyde dehydrogenase/glutarate-semialdehyde dehydrogenase